MYTGEKITPYIAEICALKGVEYAIVCPGSRSAPLTLAFARNSRIQTLPMVDERSAGYYALGIGIVTQKPVVLICTSGTAVLNLAPAIAEAYYQQIPLLVLTADRPKEWIDQMDGQAIHQQDVFKNFVKASYALRGEAHHPDDLWEAQRIVNEAFNNANRPCLGPVHVNISFREPLYELPLIQQSIQVIREPERDIRIREKELHFMARQLNAAESIIVLAGHCSYHPKMIPLLRKVSKIPGVVVIGEPISNIRGNEFIFNGNECIPIPVKGLSPDLMISFGGSITGKRLKHFLRKSPAFAHWHVAHGHHHADPFKKLGTLIPQDPIDFFEWMLTVMHPKRSSEFSDRWKSTSQLAAQERDRYLHGKPFADFTFFEQFLPLVPAMYDVHLGNSTPVRYACILGDKISDKIRVFGNRGTSGIDGTTSTAAGAAVASGKPTVLFTGDLAFQYDINAFWNSHLPATLRVVVINNQGGNIFRIIDGPSGVSELETYFQTPMPTAVSKQAAAYNLAYFEVRDFKNLADTAAAFLDTGLGKAAVLEVFTDGTVSEQLFKGFYQHLLEINI